MRSTDHRFAPLHPFGYMILSDVSGLNFLFTPNDNFVHCEIGRLQEIFQENNDNLGFVNDLSFLVPLSFDGDLQHFQ